MSESDYWDLHSMLDMKMFRTPMNQHLAALMVKLDGLTSSDENDDWKVMY